MEKARSFTIHGSWEISDRMWSSQAGPPSPTLDHAISEQISSAMPCSAAGSVGHRKPMESPQPGEDAVGSAV